MALERVVALTSLRVPNLGFLVKGARNNLVTTANSIRLEDTANTYPNGLLKAIQ